MRDPALAPRRGRSDRRPPPDTQYGRRRSSRTSSPVRPSWISLKRDCDALLFQRVVDINALRALAPLPAPPFPGHHAPSPAHRSSARAAGTAHIGLLMRQPRPPGCERDARRAPRWRQAANRPAANRPRSARMTPRGWSTTAAAAARIRQGATAPDSGGLGPERATRRCARSFRMTTGLRTVAIGVAGPRARSRHPRFAGATARLRDQREQPLGRGELPAAQRPQARRDLGRQRVAPAIEWAHDAVVPRLALLAHRFERQHRLDVAVHLPASRSRDHVH